ncbi:26268_t:CDS:2 [Gigaspora rosea]|nr:26268_t:CDS:2 [Gigaspora rosea]
MPVTIKGTLYVKPTKPTEHVQIPLSTSLEDVLNDYYPLAGTLIIDCNDRGVQFIIAECSDITINQLENNKWEHAVIPYGLAPSQPRANKIYPILLKVQHTTFADGS